MSQDSYIQIRISNKEKEAARKVLDTLGISFSGAVKIFLRQIVLDQKIPFDIDTEKTAPKRTLEKKPEKGQTSGPQWTGTSFQKRSIG